MIPQISISQTSITHGVVLAALLWVAAACAEPPKWQEVVITPPASPPVRVRAEVRNDDNGRAKGLMFRQTLAEDEGMLFIWPTSGQRAFWMKNTPLPLDMLFIHNQRVVAIIAWAKPYDTTLLNPGVASDSVLEVNGGFAQRHGITLGSHITSHNIYYVK